MSKVREVIVKSMSKVREYRYIYSSFCCIWYNHFGIGIGMAYPISECNLCKAQAIEYFIKLYVELFLRFINFNCSSSNFLAKPYSNQTGHNMGKRLLVFFHLLCSALQDQHPGWEHFPLISPQTIWHGSTIHPGFAIKRFLIFTPPTLVYLLYQFCNKQIY